MRRFLACLSPFLLCLGLVLPPSAASACGGGCCKKTEKVGKKAHSCCSATSGAAGRCGEKGGCNGKCGGKCACPVHIPGAELPPVFSLPFCGPLPVDRQAFFYEGPHPSEFVDDISIPPNARA